MIVLCHWFMHKKGMVQNPAIVESRTSRCCCPEISFLPSGPLRPRSGRSPEHSFGCTWILSSLLCYFKYVVAVYQLHLSTINQKTIAICCCYRYILCIFAFTVQLFQKRNIISGSWHLVIIGHLESTVRILSLFPSCCSAEKKCLLWEGSWKLSSIYSVIFANQPNQLQI